MCRPVRVRQVMRVDPDQIPDSLKEPAMEAGQPAADPPPFSPDPDLIGWIEDRQAGGEQP